MYATRLGGLGSLKFVPSNTLVLFLVATCVVELCVCVVNCHQRYPVGAIWSGVHGLKPCRRYPEYVLI